MPHKKKGKLKSFKKMYIHKLNFYLNQTTTTSHFNNSSHITLPLSRLYTNSCHTYTDSHTKTLDSLLSEDQCIKLDLEIYTWHILFLMLRSVPISNLDTVCFDQFLFQTSYIVSIYTGLIHMSYSDQLYFKPQT